MLNSKLQLYNQAIVSDIKTNTVILNVIKEDFIMSVCTGCCNCCRNLLKAEKIVTTEGITTITVKTGSFVNIHRCDKVCIGLFAAIPELSDCNKVVITDGTTLLNTYKNEQFWRPCNLKCRSTLVFKYLDDPALLVIEKVKGRMCE